MKKRLSKYFELSLLKLKVQPAIPGLTPSHLKSYFYPWLSDEEQQKRQPGNFTSLQALCVSTYQTSSYFSKDSIYTHCVLLLRLTLPPPCWKRLLSNCVHSIDFFPLLRLLSFPLPCRVVSFGGDDIRQWSEELGVTEDSTEMCWKLGPRKLQHRIIILHCYGILIAAAVGGVCRNRWGGRQRRCWCGFGEQENGCFTPPWGDASRSGTYAEYIP